MSSVASVAALLWSAGVALRVTTTAAPPFRRTVKLVPLRGAPKAAITPLVRVGATSAATEVI